MLQVGLIDSFITLVRLGIGHGKDYDLRFFARNSETIDWDKMEVLAQQHGLLPVIVDGIAAMRQKCLSSALPSSEETDNYLPPQEMLLEWIGEVMLDYEQRYELYRQVISEMAAFYNSHGYKMMVLKGYACSLDWPKPNHRPCGDIDIWQFGKQKEADALLAKEKGVKIDFSHHHHTVFEWDDFSVENHYDFVNVHHHKSNAEFEKILKQLGEDDSHSVEVNGEKIYLPSPNLHALFLLKHLMMHFASEGIMLRQVVDWAFFVEKHGKDVDWNYVQEVLDRFGMHQMFNIINTICVSDLGFDVVLFPSVQCNPSLKERVMNEILTPQYSSSVPNNIVCRVVFKIRRWRDNEWKHQLCYKDSMWSAFWSGVWNHLLKPSSI